MNVLVLGSTGMLGRAVADELERLGHDVVRACRRGPVHFDVDSFLKSQIKLPEAEYVVNCIGAIKQRYGGGSYEEGFQLFNVNSWFPHALWTACKARGAKMIHVTTDCVFAGTIVMPTEVFDAGIGTYGEHDKHDVDDDYGKSKSLGEPNCMVLRTSLVGLESGSSHSLLGWAMSKKGQEIEGYTNHFWNGVTNIQFGRICDRIIRNVHAEPNWWAYVGSNHVKHVFSPDIVSKYRLLELFNERFDLDLKIKPVEHSTYVNRTLTTDYELNSLLNIPSIVDQINDL